MKIIITKYSITNILNPDAIGIRALDEKNAGQRRKVRRKLIFFLILFFSFLIKEKSKSPSGWRT
ncbi:MAG TPA: hypothetical protein VKA38_08490 [Draconibacterium sp.]|nr:hypothetical protein [Draconibacterium sp.]